MHGLLLLFGESFRDGEHQSRKRDTKKSFLPQKNASESHNRFCDYIMKTYNIPMDIFINTYDTKYEKELKSWYSHPLTYKSNTKVTTDKMKFKSVQVALNVVKKDKYDFILIARMDTLMKPHV